jgi:hypothetical protein
MTENPRTRRDAMKAITTQYIDGEFVESHGRVFGTFGIEAFLESRAILE